MLDDQLCNPDEVHDFVVELEREAIGADLPSDPA
jgi:hypothetical protein